MSEFPHRVATPARVALFTALVAISSAHGIQAQSIIGPPARSEPRRVALRTPESFFGFQMGADKKMAHWNDMVRYYELLGKTSNRMKVVNMGLTSEGHPFLALFISSPKNLAKLEQIRGMNAKLSDPRGVPQAEIDAIVKNGKAVVLQSMSMHSTEIGGSQMAVELVYDQLTRNDDEALRILDNVVSIIVPSFNPDGEIMVTEWYRKTLGTESEGTSPPWLYQKYAGHDNNRDAFQQNLPDSRYIAKLLFRDWIPQAYVDHHHMGSNGARIFLPPYADPVRPSADPIVWRELAWYGAHMATKEEEYGMSGVINDAVYSGWGHMGFHWITPFHNIAGMLTESASARLASPMTITKEQLVGNTRNLQKYEEQTNFPNPWPGGVWHLRDVVDRQKISAWAALDLAARNKEMVLRNAYLKALHQTERGEASKPTAFIVPFSEQHDPLTAMKMIDKLLAQGVEVKRSATGFIHEGKSYGAGTYVVSMAQPKMGVVRWMLGRTFYPDNAWTRDNDGNPIRPYDMSTDAMTEFMGVRSDPVDTKVTAELAKVTSAEPPAGKVAAGSKGYLIDGRANDAFRAANLLFDKGISLRRVDKSAGALRVGDFLLPPNTPADLVSSIAKQTGVTFAPNDVDASNASRAIKRARVAMYQRYNGGNADEGWTRLVFEQWNQPFSSLFDPELKGGNLAQKFDVIILPSDNPATLVGRGGGAGRGAIAGNAPATPGARDPNPRGGGGNALLGGPGGVSGGRGGGGGGGAGGGGTAPVYPLEFRSGFGDEGVKALQEFVQAGGTLVTFADAGSLAIERFQLPVRDVVAGLPYKQFWSPGSTLKISVDTENPLGYGMPSSALAIFLAGSQAYEILPAGAQSVQTIATFADSDILQSGWLLGESVIAGRPAMLSVPYGQGRVVLIGFRVQHRAQAHGTYKLLFNALMGRP
ncbi:MAG: M14 metallopeptidase family protein [bacterium]